MSEPIPESIPTSADPRTHRPTKKRALSPRSTQANQLDALFKHPDREIAIPAGPRNKNLPPPPEIVANVQGSSAGAGSGEFHVYKASRRREYERLRLMDEETKSEQQNKEFEEKMAEMRKKDSAKTNKNKARRDKAKARKQKRSENGDSAGASDATNGTENAQKKLGHGLKRRNSENDDAVDFTANGSAETSNPDETGIVIHDED
ncbi:uncharacterized protein BKCO1_2200078 [Diplodia corticola]|uniref:Duf1168 domain protein n=1 Tax=Diplodia corticola TaxID=236234 RepID=A0A1J9S3F5_9PEZI|nr:uncharacterized protein BKCO1_2200078 [Diplodia corticola]OJD34532.1 hypothetical protein BKCO1_2200078 [Diplodia corticola]